MFWSGPRGRRLVRDEGKNTADVPKMPHSSRTPRTSQRQQNMGLSSTNSNKSHFGG